MSGRSEYYGRVRDWTVVYGGGSVDLKISFPLLLLPVLSRLVSENLVAPS